MEKDDIIYILDDRHATVAVEGEAVDSAPQKPVIKLSKRQLQIISALSEGAIYKEIAHSLGISENTVAFHMSALRKKLNSRTSNEVLIKALALKLI